MGNAQSEEKIRRLEKQQNELHQQNALLLKRLQDRDTEVQKQNQAALEQVAKLMLLAALAQTSTKAPNENKNVEIEGTKYQLVEFVNRGGFGEIHKARVAGRSELVAVKIMKYSTGNEEEIKNEINFLRLTKKIRISNHPVIEYFGSKITSDSIYIAMELAAQDLLQFWLQQVSENDKEKLGVMGIIITVYVLRALAFLEGLNIIHGDIKPQNLVIVPTEKAFCVKLIDFGTVEKMQTRRADLTVDMTKAFTLFFVSPEFLKRDSKNLVTRRLHKKSDAWAAGVMFYLLFCGELPWNDQFGYENFCNDPKAADVTVPDIGAFKMIIELLLKKNPDDRSSAQATLLHMKSHPNLGGLIEQLDKNFCPVDDVCNMKVPAEVRQGLAQMARPGNMSHAKESRTTTAGRRRFCRYGRGCYDKSEDHREEFAHPGDPDFLAEEKEANAGKVACRYGAECYRKDPTHLEKYSHPGDKMKVRCRYGAECYDNGTDHRRQYWHPDSLTVRPGPKKEKCRFGEGCTRRNDREHMMTYLHDQ